LNIPCERREDYWVVVAISGEQTTDRQKEGRIARLINLKNPSTILKENDFLIFVIHSESNISIINKQQRNGKNRQGS